MRVALIGAGLMGAQIAAEYALGGHDVQVVAPRTGPAGERIGQAFDLVVAHGLADTAAAGAARARIALGTDPAAVDLATALVVESVSEDLATKGEVLRAAGAAAPGAVLASNTSSIPITRIGEAAGAPERTIGTHYWNPPLLMPLVEIIATERTAPGVVEVATDALRSLGKRPVVARRDVPGFVWNRLQFALLREAVWLVEQGVASPETVDEIVRDGLARRWRYTGPFQTAALGGGANFQRIANNLWPELSAATSLDGLLDLLPGDDALAGVRERRDAGLLRDLLAERQGEATT